MANTMTMTDNRTGKSWEFPILSGTKGPDVVDIGSFYSQTGMFTFDQGYTSTASCKSAITFIDGEKGELMHRGYDIAWLAENKKFLDVVYLLLYKKLPSKEELESFRLELKQRSYINEKMLKLFDALPDKAHPMAALQSTVAMMSAYYKRDMNIDDISDFMELAKRLVAKIPTIIAFYYRHVRGFPQIYPDLDRGFVENFLYMLRAFPHDRVNLKPIEVKAFEAV